MWGSSRHINSAVIDWTSVPAEMKFTLPHLRNLHKKLSENKVVTPSNQNMVIEILRVLSEMVVFGDNKSETLFE